MQYVFNYTRKFCDDSHQSRYSTRVALRFKAPDDEAAIQTAKEHIQRVERCEKCGTSLHALQWIWLFEEISSDPPGRPYITARTLPEPERKYI